MYIFLYIFYDFECAFRSQLPLPLLPPFTHTITPIYCENLLNFLKFAELSPTHFILSSILSFFSSLELKILVPVYSSQGSQTFTSFSKPDMSESEFSSVICFLQVLNKNKCFKFFQNINYLRQFQTGFFSVVLSWYKSNSQSSLPWWIFIVILLH